jgi:eukaryotic-like serine/threonine-protein kinase
LLLEVTSATDPIIKEVAESSEGQFSSDGVWIVHNGQDGIVVRRFPGPGPRIQIAGYGANQPRWSRNGKQIFYIARDKELMAASFDSKTQTASQPRVLFPTRIVASAFTGFQFDVTLDRRFIVNSLKSAAPPLSLVTGWTTDLRTLAPDF